MATINQKPTIDTTKPKRKECKHTTKENNQTIMEETKRKMNKKDLQKQLEKQ